MADRTFEALANLNGKTREDIVKFAQNTIPLGRIGQPDDVANLVSFLASKHSDYITGQGILINGGTYFS